MNNCKSSTPIHPLITFTVCVFVCVTSWSSLNLAASGSVISVVSLLVNSLLIERVLHISSVLTSSATIRISVRALVLLCFVLSVVSMCDPSIKPVKLERAMSIDLTQDGYDSSSYDYSLQNIVNNNPNIWSSAPTTTGTRLGNRRTYAPPGTRTPYSRQQGNHARNSNHPASTNPSAFWIGTYFPSDDEQQNYTRLSVIPELRLNTSGVDIRCFRGQWEVGDKGDKAGKLHAQFAVAFTAKVRSPQARDILGDGFGGFFGWLQPARSEAVWDYVTKLETRVAEIPAFGDMSSEQGNRTDLDVVYADIANGMSIWEVMDKYTRTFARNHGAISKLCAMYDKPRPYGDCHVEIWYGVTGSGKSHKAYHTFPDAYRKTVPGKWWEGYRGQKDVIFEEFNPEEDKELRLPELLKILDKYPYQVEIKGASMQLKANRFIFTTNIDPRGWYNGHPQQAALHRRINKVKVFKWDYQTQIAKGSSGVLEFDGIQGLPSKALTW